MYHYQITLESGSEYLQTRGKISVTLVGTLQTVTTIFDKYVNGNIYKKKLKILFSDKTIFIHDSIQTRFIPLIINIGEVIEVNIEFKKTENWIISSWYSSLWKFNKITVLNGDQQQRYTFCPTEENIASGTTVRFTSC